MNQNELYQNYCYSNKTDKKRIRIKIIGLINSVAYQKARLCAEKLHQHLPYAFASPDLTDMFQVDWHEYIQKTKRRIGGKVWALKRPVIVFMDEEYIGCDVEFLRHLNQTYVLSLPIELGYYESLITEQCELKMKNSKRKYVYFTFTEEGSIIGSFVFMLYSDLLPITCQHFITLCTGHNELKESNAKPYYKNKCVNRVVKNGWVQCGDVDSSDYIDDSSDSVTIIPDESYCIPHDRRGVLSMANDGKHCNESQFVICSKPNPWMNHYYVAIGQLIDGAKTLKILEDLPTYYEKPTTKIIISYCGEYTFEKQLKLEKESKIFLTYRSTDGEEAGHDRAFKHYSITPWLDNIIDKIDIRDRPSLLKAERYLSGLYCLSTDYIQGMDMRIYESIEIITKCDTTSVSRIRELLLNFQPDMMTEEEKLHYVFEISNIILAYVFDFADNVFCLKHISRDTRKIIYKILEIAHKIASCAVSKAEEEPLILDTCADLKLNKIFGMKNLEFSTKFSPISKRCLLLLQGILNEAILYLISTNAMQE